MPGWSVWITASTATDECCNAEKTNARLIPNRAPAERGAPQHLLRDPPARRVRDRPDERDRHPEPHRHADERRRRDQLRDRRTEPPDHDDARHHRAGDGRRRVRGGILRPDGDPGNWGTGAHPADRSRAPCADLQLEDVPSLVLGAPPGRCQRGGPRAHTRHSRSTSEEHREHRDPHPRRRPHRPVRVRVRTDDGSGQLRRRGVVAGRGRPRRVVQHPPRHARPALRQLLLRGVEGAPPAGPVGAARSAPTPTARGCARAQPGCTCPCRPPSSSPS